MATAAQWVEGARPRTLPAAVAPVLVGAGAAAAVDAFVLGRVLLALVVALALQVAVNYANDYSDGIRGTDSQRVGPRRLIGSGVAAPAEVKRAAFMAFGVAMVAGLLLVLLAQAWWLLIVGAAAIAAAWFYTGGSRPYGYEGFGEISVFVFFGLVAVVGTAYVQAGRILPGAVIGGVAIGSLACALLVVNNLRDIPSDAEAGKHTLAVQLGQARTRMLYLALVVIPYALAVALSLLGRPWAALALLSLPLALRVALPVQRGAGGRELIAVLRGTGQLELVYAALLALGLALSG